MSLSEFDVIKCYFSRSSQRGDVPLGIGDDAAILQVPADKLLVVAMDTLVAGRHFPEQTSPYDIGWKALAVNLSDLAAMAATPAWITLSITMPEIDEHWLQSFSDGFFSLADQYSLALVGGDTTRGPLSITVQVHGLVSPGEALCRHTAKPGQKIFVTGTLGDAALALHQLQTKFEVAPPLLQQLNRPQPRVQFGQQLSSLAGAAIDISDGLHADLSHILEASGCGACIYVDQLPTSKEVLHEPMDLRRELQIAGGDDYELCFTVKDNALEMVQTAAAECNLEITEIGVIEEQSGLRCKTVDGDLYQPVQHGFDHFRE